MVNNSNLIPKENIAKIEEIREINNEIPSYEEFMKTYENDEQVKASYLDEINSYGDLGVEKGYGPCNSCSGSNRNLNFELAITLLNCIGDGKGCTVCNVDSARKQARNIVAKTGHWTNFFYSHFSQGDRKKLSDKINGKINYHREGNAVNESVCNKDPVEIDWEGVLNHLELANELIDRGFSVERHGRSSLLE